MQSVLVRDKIFRGILSVLILAVPSTQASNEISTEGSTREYAESYEKKHDIEYTINIKGRSVSTRNQLKISQEEKQSEFLTNLGKSYLEKYKLEKAEIALLEALSIEKKITKEEGNRIAKILELLAEIYLEKDEYDKADPILIRALKIHEKNSGKISKEIGISLTLLGQSYQSQGLYKKALATFSRSLSIDNKLYGEDHYETAISINNMGVLYMDMGSYEKAKTLLIKALSIIETRHGPEHKETARQLYNLGLVHEYQSNYKQAEILGIRSLNLHEKLYGIMHPYTAHVTLFLAGVYRSQGLYRKAEPLFEKAIETRETLHGANHSQTARALNGLALMYEFQGLYKKAETLYIRALSIFEEVLGTDHPAIATTLHNLAEIYSTLGLLQKAANNYERAIAIEEQILGHDNPTLSITLANFGSLNAKQGKHKIAESLLLRAINIQEKTYSDSSSSKSFTLFILAQLYKKTGRYNEAIKFFEKALSIDKNLFGNKHEATASIQSSLAETYAILGNHNKAISLFKDALTTEAYLIQREVPAMARKDRETFVETFGYTYEKIFSGVHLNKFTAATALFSRLNRHGLLEEAEKRQAQLIESSKDSRKLALQLRTLTKELSSFSLAASKRKYLRNSLARLERKLYRLLPEYEPRIVEIKDVAAEIPSKGALIEFQKYSPFDGKQQPSKQWKEPRYLAFVLKRNENIEVIDLGLAEPIDEKVEKALFASESRDPNAETLWNQVASHVIEPLAEALVDIKTLIISPDAELNRIPFAALPAPNGETLISDKYQLRIVTTGRELIDLQQAHWAHKNNSLVVANPDFDFDLSSTKRDTSKEHNEEDGSSSIFMRASFKSTSNNRLVWEPLPGTDKEGKDVAELINGQLHVYQKATAASIQRVTSPLILHIASHAFYLPGQGKEQSSNEEEAGSRQLRGNRSFSMESLGVESPLLRSGVALAGANRILLNQNTTAADDGYLTALEVAQLDWRGTELVVISACESGQGEIKTGEGIYGLKRAIAVSGARSSLLSLWKVDDAATAAFMKDFYKRLKEGESRAYALSSTQRFFRNHPIPAWRHPSFWAAFQLSGDWGPIKFN